MIDREQQLAHAGAVACLEGLLKFNQIKKSEIPFVKKKVRRT